jgi:phosphatidylinositol alpha-1,6-mannosyltransferase
MLTSPVRIGPGFIYPTNLEPSTYSVAPGVLLTTDFPPIVGGISNLLFNIYSRFDLRNMTVIAPDYPGAEKLDSLQQYNAKRLSRTSSIRRLCAAQQVFKLHGQARHHIDHHPATLMHCGHVNAAFAARRLKRRYGTKYLVWTYALEVMDEWLRPLILPALRAADLIITISEFTQTFLLSIGIPSSQIVRIRPGADPEYFRPGLSYGEIANRLRISGRPTLLTVSRIVKANRYKGHDVVIRSLPAVARAIPNIAYLIVGQGDDLEYLKTLARDCGVSNLVVFAGPVANAELPLLYNACDAFIMCSRQERNHRGILAEGFGLALLEASACAKPVIAGRSGGIPDAVMDGTTGVLVNPTDPESVSRTLIEIFRNPEMGRTLGENGRKWVKAEMNWDRAAREFAGTLQKLQPGEKA